jgi:hypothetical protein
MQRVVTNAYLTPGILYFHLNVVAFVVDDAALRIPDCGAIVADERSA